MRQIGVTFRHYVQKLTGDPTLNITPTILRKMEATFAADNATTEDRDALRTARAHGDSTSKQYYELQTATTVASKARTARKRVFAAASPTDGAGHADVDVEDEAQAEVAPPPKRPRKRQPVRAATPEPGTSDLEEEPAPPPIPRIQQQPVTSASTVLKRSAPPPPKQASATTPVVLPRAAPTPSASAPPTLYTGRKRKDKEPPVDMDVQEIVDDILEMHGHGKDSDSDSGAQEQGWPQPGDDDYVEITTSQEEMD